MGYNDLAKAIKELRKNDAPTSNGKRAYLGFKQSGASYDIPVSGKPGFVWVRIEDGQERSVSQARNDARVSLIPDLPVRVANDGVQLIVLGMDSSATTFLGNALGIVNTNEPGSGNMEPISARRISAGLIGVHPDGGKQVYVYPFSYNRNGTDYYYSGGTLNLAAYWPSSGNKRWIKLGFDPVAAAPVAVAGDDFPTITDIPKSELASILFDGYFTFAGVQVIGDQSGVISEQQFADFSPWRSGAGYEDWLHNITSALRLWGGDITDNGDGTVDVDAGGGLSKDDEAVNNAIPASLFDGQGSRVKYVTWSAQSSVALTDDAHNHIYYDGSAAAIAVTDDESNISFTRDFIIAHIYRSGTTLVIHNTGHDGWNWFRRSQEWFVDNFPVVLSSGGVVSETGTRNLAVTAGVIWFEGLDRNTTAAIDTSGADTFDYWYRDGIGGWTQVTAQTQINNTNYDDGSGVLASLTVNRYGAHWIYLDHQGDLHVVYGQGNYQTLAQAEAASPPSSLPGLITAFSTIIAKIIIQQGAASFTSVEQANAIMFSPSGITDHGSLAGLTDDDHTQYALNTHSFVTVASEARFSAERVATAGSGISLADGGAGTTLTFALDIASESEITAPDTAADWIAISDTSGGDAIYKVAPDNLINNPGVCQGRLSLSSSDPAPTADQTAKTTVYFLPYNGELVSIYNGARWVNFNIGTGISVSVPSTTVTPFDVFVYDNSGTPTLSTTDWTNDTTRATGITLQDGVYVKSGATGYRYLGTGRTTGSSGQTEDSTSNRFLWNYYNRLHRVLSLSDNTSHTNGSSSWVEWNSGTGGPFKSYMVVGWVDEPFLYSTFGAMFDAGRTSIGVNTVGAPSVNENSNSNAAVIRATASGAYTFSIGYSYVALVERGAAGPATLQAAAFEVIING